MISNINNGWKKEYFRILSNGPSGIEDYDLAKELIDSGYADGKYRLSKIRDKYNKVENLIWQGVNLKGRNFLDELQPEINLKTFHLDKDFQSIVNKLICQMQDDLAHKNSQLRTKIIKNFARNGWDFPPGEEYEAIDNLSIDSIRIRGENIWKALEETLNAFNPPFYKELAAELHSLADSFFPLSLCKPHDYLSRMGWERPNTEEAIQQLRYQLESQRTSSISILKTKIDLYAAKKSHSPMKPEIAKKYDVFICHASEDKNDFVRPLAEALTQKKVAVWYDEYCIGWGDSIRQTIDKGLISCKLGIVVFSHAFFDKKWPQNELDALNQRMIDDEIKILPIWHKISEEDLKNYSPLFSGRLAKSSDKGIEVLTSDIELILHKVI